MPAGPAPKSPRRSLLFTPGDSPRKIDKIGGLEADTIILDLEDAVAPGEKETARKIVCHVLTTVDFGRKERLVRLNATTTPFFSADLAAVSAAKPDGLVIPRVESAAGLQKIDRVLKAAEQRQGLPGGAIRLFALIETARGIMNLKEIAQATPRLEVLIFGAEDFAADVGAKRTRAGWEIFYARSAVVTAAAANDLQAIDTVFTGIRQLDGLKEDAFLARNMGFSGKLAIHPGQLATINNVFSPTAAEIAAALRLLQQAAEEQKKGSSVFTLDGKMVDAPMVLAAQRLLIRAQLCGLLPANQ